MGVGIFAPDLNLLLLSYSISGSPNTCQTEILAIYKATLIALEYKLERCTIITDSKCAVDYRLSQKKIDPHVDEIAISSKITNITNYIIPDYTIKYGIILNTYHRAQYTGVLFCI